MLLNIFVYCKFVLIFIHTHCYMFKKKKNIEKGRMSNKTKLEIIKVKVNCDYTITKFFWLSVVHNLCSK